MKYRNTILSVLSFLCGTSAAQAAPPDLFWHNTQGFKSAAQCQITSLKSIPFYISEGESSSPFSSSVLQTASGAQKSYLVNRSLVRLSEKGKVRKGFKLIDVIGVSQMPKASVGKNSAQRMDDGYIAESSLKNLEDYVLEIKPGLATKEIPGTKVSTIGTFWQLATENDQVQAFRCNLDGKPRDFMIFDVFTADSSQPIARVGVNSDHTGIFRSILTHLPKEADKVLDSRMTQTPSDSKQSLESAAGTSVAANVTSPLEVVKSAGEEIKSQKEAQNKIANKALLAPAASATSTASDNVAAASDSSQASSANDNSEDGEDASLKLINSKQEYVVCIDQDTLNVRDESLEKVLFTAEKNETVLPFQSWDTKDTKKKNIGGKEYTFIKIQFPEKDGNNVGWLAKDYVRLEGQCSVTKTKDELAAPFTPVKAGPIKGIDSPACCGFPTIKRPTQSYLTGMRRFKAGRGKGHRLHAACDLYRVHGEQAVSIADGKLARSLYSFYQGTYALEMQYPGGFIARYGELTGKRVKNLSSDPKRGQTLGYIGTVNSGCCQPMLHFELYSGDKKGSLTAKGNKFNRRSDLINPTKYLLKWEKNTFGTSY